MIKINDQYINIVKDSLVIDATIEERSTCSFSIIDSDGIMEFRKGENVEVYDEEVLIFAGVVDVPKSQRLSPSKTKIHDLIITDWHYLADKRIIAKAYENEFVGDIARDILLEKLTEEGVTADLDPYSVFLSPHFNAEYQSTSTIDKGPVIIEAVFNYVRVSKALDILAEKANFWWKIDPRKKLYFVAKTAFKAPFEITDNICEKGSIQVAGGNNQYRNVQYIKGARDITDPHTETRRGDGETQTFFTGFPVAKAPTIEVSYNGGAFQQQTVGIRGLETNKQWYWSKGDNTLSQEPDDVKLTNQDVWRITYQGEFDVIVTSRLDNEIIKQSGIDGTSGIIEDVADEPQTTGREAAFESANSKLERYGKIGKTLTFRTWKKGLEVGMLLTVDLPAHGLNKVEMLVETITTTYEDNMFWFRIKAVEGATNNSWTKFFGAMATKDLVIRENVLEDQIFTSVASFQKNWGESDNPNIFKEIYASDTLFPSDNLYPSFDPIDRVKYFSWYNSSGEQERKPITKQTVIDGQIDSVNYLSPLDANGQITHVGWWGGIDATEELGTGVQVDLQPYDKVKTQLEAIQVEKTDIRNFAVSTGNLLITSHYMSALADRVSEVLAKSV